ncbi:hypothetical protein [Nocardia grenadensis]
MDTSLGARAAALERLSRHRSVHGLLRRPRPGLVVPDISWPHHTGQEIVDRWWAAAGGHPGTPVTEAHPHRPGAPGPA